MKHRSIILTILSYISLFPVIASAGSYIGNENCYPCHRDIKKTFLKDSHYNVVLNIHGTSLESVSCEACHGPGADHKENADGEEMGPLKTEGFKKVKGGDAKQNNFCLKCHESGNHMHWRGSAHELEQIRCVDCHIIHSEEKTNGTDVCIGCHRKQKARLLRSSRHPLREGEMTCTDCHNPHGGKGSSLIKTATVNELCYECHDEKRGPLIWEHSPVRENCSTCHDPHGSSHPSLLKTKVPYLCQSCHLTQIAHSNKIYDANTLLASQTLPFMRAKGCLNCHSMIHGSNHPSGARFTR